MPELKKIDQQTDDYRFRPKTTRKHENAASNTSPLTDFNQILPGLVNLHTGNSSSHNQYHEERVREPTIEAA